MHFDRFMKAWKARSFHPQEREAVLKGFFSLSLALGYKRLVELSTEPPVFSGLYVYAQNSEEQLNQVAKLVNAFIGGDFDPVVPAELQELVGSIWVEIQHQRLDRLLSDINSKKSMAISHDENSYLSSLHDPRATKLYENQSERLNVDFTVTTLPFRMEVLDPRLVRVAAGKANELHRHAHETVFVFLEGKGRVRIDELSVDVCAGSFVFIPRWCMHQTINDGTSEMSFLAVADFGLTGKSFVGNYLKTARLLADS